MMQALQLFASRSLLQTPQLSVLLGFRQFQSNAPVSDRTANGPPAFVFDIDGVLIRGKNVLSASHKAIEKLTINQQSWRYPVCFLTNGGGMTEAQKAEELSSWLNAPVHESQVVLSHTPMRELVGRLGSRPVLVSGLGDVEAAARSYGFTQVLHTRELGQALRTATPFSRYTESPSAPDPVREEGWGTLQRPIEAVLVMKDPDDWYRDLQLMLDVVMSGGIPHSTPHEHTGRVVEVYFSNPDMLWANEFPRPRLGQGAFAAALQSLHQQLTGTPLPFAKFFGKPNPEPYRLVERLLTQQAQQLGLLSEAEVTSASNRHHPPFSAIFAVGDNPAADIRGANAAGAPWVSVLVRTGVFQGPGRNCSTDPAHVVVDDVLQAVEAGLHRYRTIKWHQHR